MEKIQFKFWARLIGSAIIGCLLLWLTHIIFCFNSGEWGYLIAGAILFPIALFHGAYIWLTSHTILTIIGFFLIAFWIMMGLEDKKE